MRKPTNASIYLSDEWKLIIYFKENNWSIKTIVPKISPSCTPLHLNIGIISSTAFNVAYK